MGDHGGAEYARGRDVVKIEQPHQNFVNFLGNLDLDQDKDLSFK
jgi:hypothetical protein